MIDVLPENNMEGPPVDCDHLIVDLESRPVTAIDDQTYVHWFTCLMCKVKACIVDRVAVP